MDSVDEDFGDLYLDVETQASSALNGVSKSLNSSTVSEESGNPTGTRSPRSGDDAERLALVTNKSSGWNCDMANADAPNHGAEASDSDDDFNIVLNDGDANVITRPRSAGVDEEEAGAKENGSVQNQKLGNQGTRSNVSMITRRTEGNGCSLPWEIFDVNFDTFAEKPWKYPGADITDFFNFGLNEISWKDYCNSLVVEEEADVNAQINTRSAYAEQTHTGSRMGRAIAVEESNVERIPSAELYRPHDRDSDVINVDDTAGDLSGLTCEELGHLNSSFNGTSKNNDLRLSNNRDFCSPVESPGQRLSEGSRGEQLSEDSPREHVRTLSGEQCHQTINCCSEGITRGVLDNEENGVSKNSYDSNIFMSKRELSPGDQINLSPSLSCSFGSYEASESESFRQCVPVDQLEISSSSKQTEIQGINPSDYKNVNRNNIKTGECDERKRSRNKQPNQALRKRPRRRSRSSSRQEVKHERAKDARLISVSRDTRKRYGRHESPFHKTRKCRSCRGRSDLQKNKNNHKPFWISDAGRTDILVSYSEREKRFHCFGGHMRKTLDYRDRGQPSGDENERVIEEYMKNGRSDYPYRKPNWSLREEEDLFRSYSGTRNFHKRKDAVDNVNNTDRDRYHGVKEPLYKDMMPFTSRSRSLSSNYLSEYGEGDYKLTRENELRSRYRSFYDEPLHSHAYEDEFLRGEYGLPPGFSYKDRHTFVEECGEPPVYGRGWSFSRRRDEYSYMPGLHLNRFCPSETDYGSSRASDDGPSHFSPIRESWSTQGVRNFTHDVEELGFTGAYDRQRDQIYVGKSRNAWMRSSGDSVASGSDFDRLDHSDHRGHNFYEQKRPSLRCEVRDLEKTMSHHDHKSYNDSELLSRVGTKEHDGVFARRDSYQDDMHFIDVDKERYLHKMKKGQSDVSCFNRNMVLPRREYEQGAGLDSSGLILRKRQRGICSRFEDFDKSHVNSPGTLRGFSNSLRGDILRKEKGEKTKKQKEYLGVREGRIIKEPGAASKRGSCAERGLDEKKVEIDKQWIQETLKKMEKRREKFEEPLQVIREPKTVKLQPQAESRVEVYDTNQPRPTRKRRWSGN